MFAEASVCVQRVILQHEAGEAGARDAVIILSPPSQSALMIRRCALRLASCSTLTEESVLTFTDCAIIVIYFAEINAGPDRGVSVLEVSQLIEKCLEKKPE